jgi:hypothetical protein
MPEDVIINTADCRIGRGVPIRAGRSVAGVIRRVQPVSVYGFAPPCSMPGHKWGGVIHDGPEPDRSLLVLIITEKIELRYYTGICAPVAACDLYRPQPAIAKWSENTVHTALPVATKWCIWCVFSSRL